MIDLKGCWKPFAVTLANSCRIDGISETVQDRKKYEYIAYHSIISSVAYSTPVSLAWNSV